MICSKPFFSLFAFGKILGESPPATNVIFGRRFF
jgi:hypothetical protein